MPRERCMQASSRDSILTAIHLCELVEKQLHHESRTSSAKAVSEAVWLLRDALASYQFVRGAAGTS